MTVPGYFRLLVHERDQKYSVLRSCMHAGRSSLGLFGFLSFLMWDVFWITLYSRKMRFFFSCGWMLFMFVDILLVLCSEMKS